MKDYGPQRIVCLTEETTETLYLLGEQDRIVGISGFTVRPKQARKEKPKVSAFLEANIEEILDLKPDLVIGFSDIQADIAQQLIKQGITVWVNNHRSVEGCMKMMVQLGSLVDKKDLAIKLVSAYQDRIKQMLAETNNWPIRPKIYFEEWFDPLITAIEWVSELIQIAGGDYIFKEFQAESLAINRIIKSPQKVVEKNPDIIIASWCGKKFKPNRMIERPSWNEINAIKNGDLHEIDSSVILQPGPAALSVGLEQLHTIFKQWVEKNSQA